MKYQLHVESESAQGIDLGHFIVEHRFLNIYMDYLNVKYTSLS